MRSPVRNPRPLDHLVLPTADLSIARARLTALGFNVAPDGVHPFGTRNCCVYFADGTFVEPLAVGDEGAAEKAAQAGNVFVACDKAYRARHGDEGFSALVLGAGDARADHERFKEQGCSAGEMLAFSRPFVNAEGLEDTASFLLAFAADPAAPDSLFFTCERINVPRADRSALEEHANGVAGVSHVVLSAPYPARHGHFLRQLTGGELRPTASGIDLETANGIVSVLHPSALKSSFGIEAGDDKSLRLRAVIFRLSDRTVAERLFAANNIACQRLGNRIVVAPAAGQGATFAFEAQE